MKRIFDILAAATGVVLLSPLMLLIAIIVKIDSRGPVFYRGIRSGKNGRVFRIMKYRSMVVDAEMLGGFSTAKNDFRVTRIGRYLRRYKLDELPQLLNVLKGEMSIVGPRPEVPAYTSLYSGDELMILTVRPGITDYSSIRFSQLDQVLGENDADKVYEETVRPIKNALRIKYVKEKSFCGDISIIFRTILKIMGVSYGIH
jgi:lipopolysaccharide/colanic/teichoic acid biosynthesis glycosyltransferase